jgi:hypothetical protein
VAGRFGDDEAGGVRLEEVRKSPDAKWIEIRDIPKLSMKSCTSPRGDGNG